MRRFFLKICDKELSYSNHKCEFSIGIFSSYKNAEKTAKHYLKNVNGFKDYKCDYEIINKELVGDVQCDKVYIVIGWNENDSHDETDTVESDCYADRERAMKELEIMKQRYHRKEWSIDEYMVDKCLWKEGFIRA